ncbi:probable chitinase 2 [Danaus plexippus]|uniref:probable chitinase 2 n=1 Tax=Danaus plexippus TaxID=13037 RepID=UPI002AAF55C6|nr:probable chitinase 2 [Danaus plexippus]
MFVKSLYLVVFLLNLTQLNCQNVPKGKPPPHDKLIVCLISSWAVYRPGAGAFNIEDIEPSLCTHLVYCFAGFDEETNKIKSLDPWQDLEDNYGRAAYKRVVAFKEKHPHLKVTISVGGWNEGSTKYSKLAADPAARKTFIDSVMEFLAKYKFDGLDLHWDYPTGRGGQKIDRTTYVTLLKELSEAFEPKSYLLTAAIRTTKEDMNAVYDLDQLNYYLDFIYLMTYDYHGPWDGIIAPHAPIKGRTVGDILSVDYTIRYLRDRGMTMGKLILGLPMYGRTYNLVHGDIKNVEYYSTATQTIGFSGPLSKEPAFMGYNEICSAFSNRTSGWTKGWHEKSSTAYLRNGDKFISYDSPRTIADKVKLGLDYELGGFSSWSIVTDDFRGACDEEHDTYADYIARYKKFSDEATLKQALENLAEAENKISFYTIIDNKPTVTLPKANFSNYPLLRTINNAIRLISEENKVVEEIDRIKLKRTDTIEEGSSPCIRTCSEVCFYGT